MRYVRSVSRLDKELDFLSDKYEYDTTRRFSIMFDMPETYRAKVILLDNDKPLLTISSFSWNETEPLRKAMKFGSNHQCGKINWETLRDTIHDMIDTKLCQQFVRNALPEYDKRIISRRV